MIFLERLFCCRIDAVSIIILTLWYYITFNVLVMEIFLDSRVFWNFMWRTEVDEVALGDTGNSCFDLLEAFLMTKIFSSSFPILGS